MAKNNKKAKTTTKPVTPVAPVKPVAPVTPKKPDPIKELVKEVTRKVNKVNMDNPDPMIKRAKEIFATHTVDELYFTTDGSAFTQMQHARMHGDSLKDNLVKTIKRSEIK